MGNYPIIERRGEPVRPNWRGDQSDSAKKLIVCWHKVLDPPFFDLLLSFPRGGM